MNKSYVYISPGFPSSGKASACNAGDPGLIPGSGRRDRLPTPVFLGFPGGSGGIESACSVGDLCWIPVLEDPLEEGMATHSSILTLRIPKDRGAWWAAVYGLQRVEQHCVTKHSTAYIYPCLPWF